jgi:sterol desaturase/sphingolipid hydroxylase (fatty acid hydroxylase superfamily)
MASVSLNGLMTASIIVFIAFAFYKISTTDEVDQAILDKLKEEVGASAENKIYGLIFVKTLDELTPQFTLYKIPFTDKNMFLVNQFPWISWTQILVFSILAGLVSIYQLGSGWLGYDKLQWYSVIGILILLMILSYFIGSILSYFLYYFSASALGLTRAEATLVMDEMSNGVKNVFSQMLYFSIFSLIAIFKITRNTLKDD